MANERARGTGAHTSEQRDRFAQGGEEGAPCTRRRVDDETPRVHRACSEQSQLPHVKTRLTGAARYVNFENSENR